MANPAGKKQPRKRNQLADTPVVGLVLSGGGSRGAYQTGVIKATAEIAARMGQDWPFQIITGLSAGALNAVHLASTSKSLQDSASGLAEIWGQMTAEQVFRTDPASLTGIGARWVTGLASGGLARTKKPDALLDTEPLRGLVESRLRPDAIEENIVDGRLRAICISATEYASSRGVSFVQAAEDVPLWHKKRTRGERTIIQVDHIMASAAIPLLFPAIKIDSHYYGDGCLRNLTPLLPAVEMGAERLFVVGVRQDIPGDIAIQPSWDGASAGRVLSVLINAVLMDGLEADIDYLTRVNKVVSAMRGKSDTVVHRHIPFLLIQPSRDLAEVALEHADSMPVLVRYLTRGLGPLNQTAEFISYLLFDPGYCQALLNLGYNDAMARALEIEEFLRPSKP